MHSKHSIRLGWCYLSFLFKSTLGAFLFNHSHKFSVLLTTTYKAGSIPAPAVAGSTGRYLKKIFVIILLIQ